MPAGALAHLFRLLRADPAGRAALAAAKDARRDHGEAGTSRPEEDAPPDPAA